MDKRKTGKVERKASEKSDKPVCLKVGKGCLRPLFIFLSIWHVAFTKNFLFVLFVTFVAALGGGRRQPFPDLRDDQLYCPAISDVWFYRTFRILC
jgi:hypothetical protein